MILSDGRVELTPKCILSISIFTFLKAVVGDHLQQHRPRFFSMAVRSNFRRTLSLPHNMQVWLGCIGALDPHNAILRMKYGYTHPNVQHGMEIYTFTWGVGRLAIQLASIKFKNPRLRNKRIVPVLPPNQPFFDRFAIHIWPTDGSTVVWPRSIISATRSSISSRIDLRRTDAFRVGTSAFLCPLCVKFFPSPFFRSRYERNPTNLAP